jgi:putative effector of murein hydrolase LrgA (UPF0299 family)
MRRNQQYIKRGWVGSILGMLTLSPALAGQASQSSSVAVPVTTDWSKQHVIFVPACHGATGQEHATRHTLWAAAVSSVADESV